MRRIVVATAVTVLAAGLVPSANRATDRPTETPPTTTTTVVITFGAHDVLQADLAEDAFAD